MSNSSTLPSSQKKLNEFEQYVSEKNYANVNNLKIIKYTPSSSSSRSSLKTLLAGGIAGCVAKTIIGPFDRVKILFQARKPAVIKYAGSVTGVFKAIREIFLTEGIFGLYRGHSAMLTRIFPYAGINFLAFERYKQLHFFNQLEFSYPSLHKLICGSMAGATSVTFTYPLDIFRARLAYLQQPNMPISEPMREGWVRRLFFGIRPIPPIGRIWFNTFLSLRDQNARASSYFYPKSFPSVQNVYRGYTASLCGIIPYAGVAFCTFETLKRFLKIEYSSNSSLVIVKKFMSGLFAGICGQTAAYPLDVVRRRMQLSGVNAAQHIPYYRSVTEAIIDIYRSSGIRGLYIGISINYLKVAPASAISFVTFEVMKEWLGLSS